MDVRLRSDNGLLVNAVSKLITSIVQKMQVSERFLNSGKLTMVDNSIVGISEAKEGVSNISEKFFSGLAILHPCQLAYIDLLNTHFKLEVGWAA